MTPKRPTHHLIKRLVPALAVWGVSKVLEMPRVKSRVGMFDQRVYESRRKALAGVKRSAKNTSWFTAGAAAIALGIGLMAKAAKK